MNRLQHGIVVVVLMIAAGSLLIWKTSRTSILYADGLRYIRQAKLIDSGALVGGLLKSIDHPAYPLAISWAHGLEGGDSPLDWQRAAQMASVMAGILLVIPLYLVAVELVGPRSAWMAVLLSYLAPVMSNVLADVLSEGTFLLFWTWGLWAALRFLKDGRFIWLAPMIAASGLAYFARPEGVLLPAAMVATLLLMPMLRSTRLSWPRWWAAVGLLVIGPAVLVGPYMAAKGGIGTKPAIARLIGSAPPSSNEAVERNRPLDEDQSAIRTYAVAVKIVFESIRDAVTVPVLLIVPFGLLTARRDGLGSRKWLFLGVLLSAAFLGLVRLHATGGYCSPRHAMVPALLLVPFAALGVDRLLRSVTIPGRLLGAPGEAIRPGPVFWLLAALALASPGLPRHAQPLNGPYAAYRDAADWLVEHAEPGDKVVDLTGWSQFYGGFDGYTFADVILAGADQQARWVVAREAHVYGPWEYCRIIRSLIGPLRPEVIVPEGADPDEARVYIYDRRVPGDLALMGTPEGVAVR
ncbi:glycosyltransferase family 39 protein [Tautonia sociabilis]|uniref:Glycosyltransferase family 39 protein n=1 Tax=Tautonia sociabilis TaxID=2080755 RepID=A0A432MGT9_9BACT|nr:glycosyltransferase family 39 protein [Tautonia sociabilis]RUL85738.1 glycosyltransferase family 39 protein [Tautonia sociabilis]